MADITKYYSLTDDLKQYGQVNGESNPNATTMQDMQAYMQQNGDTLDNVVKAFLWQPETDYVVGQEVRSPNLPAGYMAVCSVAGKTGTTEPSWSTTYSTFEDGTVTWKIANLYSGKVDKTTLATDKANGKFSAMPSTHYIGYSTTELSHTAECDGWVYAQAQSTVNATSALYLSDENGISVQDEIFNYATTNTSFVLMLPVLKGVSFTLGAYNATIQKYRFYYAQSEVE